MRTRNQKSKDDAATDDLQSHKEYKILNSIKNTFIFSIFTMINFIEGILYYLVIIYKSQF